MLREILILQIVKKAYKMWPFKFRLQTIVNVKRQKDTNNSLKCNLPQQKTQSNFLN